MLSLDGIFLYAVGRPVQPIYLFSGVCQADKQLAWIT